MLKQVLHSAEDRTVMSTAPASEPFQDTVTANLEQDHARTFATDPALKYGALQQLMLLASITLVNHERQQIFASTLVWAVQVS